MSVTAAEARPARAAYSPPNPPPMITTRCGDSIRPLSFVCRIALSHGILVFAIRGDSRFAIALTRFHLETRSRALPGRCEPVPPESANRTAVRNAAESRFARRPGNDIPRTQSYRSPHPRATAGRRSSERRPRGRSCRPNHERRDREQLGLFHKRRARVGRTPIRAAKTVAAARRFP